MNPIAAKMENIPCPRCQQLIDLNSKYCQHCGHSIQQKDEHIGPLRQVLLYLISFFLAPWGLIWGVKYLRSPSKEVKEVGLVCCLLTVISVILTLITVANFIAVLPSLTSQYSQLLNP